MKYHIYTLTLVIFIINFKYILNANATDCYQMYLNGTTNTSCVNTTSCCYLKYSTFGQEIQTCAERKGMIVDFCDNYKSKILNLLGELIECRCGSNSLNNSLIMNKYTFTLYFILFYINLGNF